MKLNNKIFAGVAAILISATAFTSCTESIQFGNAALQEPQTSSVTKDTVFTNAEYTRQFLTGIYALQYYGLPYNVSCGNSASPWTGKLDALTDICQIHWSNTAVYGKYYSNTLSANDTPLISFTNDNVWESVRAGWILLENIDKTPDLSSDIDGDGTNISEKERMKAEAKCLIVSRYFDLFQNFGGLPLVKKSYTGTEGTYNLPRASVDSTVQFMVGMLDEVINSGALRWAYNGSTTATDATNNTGRWTLAGAMALKAKILTFAASPLFNNSSPYYDGSTEAETQHLVWYGDYNSDRWKLALKACQDFFSTLSSKGFYQLTQASSATNEAYRQAYRMGYIYEGSQEVIHSVRVVTVDAFKSATYSWHQWCDIGRNSYQPTQEYVDMFPWSDGSPFDWETDSLAGRLTGTNGRLFYKYKIGRGSTVSKTASRDPRLYEEAIVNGEPSILDWTTGISSGDPYELWVGGYHAGYNSYNEALTSRYSTGYDMMKYYIGTEFTRKYCQWVALSLDDMYLTYAECLAQTGSLTDALTQVDVVRSRVGLGGLNGCNPDLNLTSNKDNLINEILRERACELGYSNSRYYDMVRYKRTDWMTKKLHGLLIYRLKENSSGDFVRSTDPYIGSDKDNGLREPYQFEYERFPLHNRSRAMWNLDPDSKDVKKWLLSPMPITEINKGYGMIQNPGWD